MPLSLYLDQVCNKATLGGAALLPHRSQQQIRRGKMHNIWFYEDQAVHLKNIEQQCIEIFPKESMCLLWVQICHGPACKSEGRHCTAPYLSADCRGFVEDTLLKAIPKRVILEESKKRVFEKYMVEHNLPTLAAAKAAVEMRPH